MNITGKALFKSFFVNLFLSIFKIVIGFFGKSSALIADGVHSFSDLSTDAVALFGAKYALKPADKEHPFGHGRVEYLTCLIIGLVVLLLGLEIIGTSFQGKFIIPARIVIWMSLLTIIMKFLLSTYLLKVGRKHNNAILIASGKESSADVISSLFVLLSSILMQLSNQYPILKYSNRIATIIVGILVVKTGFDIIKDNMSSIIGEQVSDVDVDEMLAILQNEETVDTVDQFAVIKNGPYFQITGEISMNEKLSLKEVHEVVEQLEEKLKVCDERARYINIHVNPSKN